jgi:hypothetical protein
MQPVNEKETRMITTKKKEVRVKKLMPVMLTLICHWFVGKAGEEKKKREVGIGSQNRKEDSSKAERNTKKIKLKGRNKLKL